MLAKFLFCSRAQKIKIKIHCGARASLGQGARVSVLNKCISKYIYVLFYVYAAIKMMAQTVLLAAASEN